jgi:hypothetical protein
MGAIADLRFIDQHSVRVRSDAEVTWAAPLRALEGAFASAGGSRVAHGLGCEDVVATGPRPLALGLLVPGFHMAAAQRPQELALAGRHRFSEHSLPWRLDDLGEAGTRLRAETLPRFPGLRGALDRALVIRTRGHVLVTRRLLGATRRRAERADDLPAQRDAA